MRYTLIEKFTLIVRGMISHGWIVLNIQWVPYPYIALYKGGVKFCFYCCESILVERYSEIDVLVYKNFIVRDL